MESERNQLKRDILKMGLLVVAFLGRYCLRVVKNPIAPEKNKSSGKVTVLDVVLSSVRLLSAGTT